MESERQRSYRIKFIILIICFVVVFFGSFMIGQYPIMPGELCRILASRFFDITRTWSSGAETVVFAVRLPRVIAGCVIGAALAVAGVSYQGMFRNPMVSPGVLGASNGAGFGAAIGILLGFSYGLITMSAFVFGIFAVFLAYALARASKVNPILSMVLSGMLISSLFSSGVSFIKLVADTQEKLPAITYWLMGSLTSITFDELKFAVIPFIIGFVPLILLRWRINLLTVGEEEALSMGIDTDKLRAVVITCSTLLTAVSVSISGVIGWVGLVIPHFCRMIWGYDYRRLIPTCMLFGATFMMAVDCAARVITTGELPIGILTSFIGAPIFAYLIKTGGAVRGD